MLSLVDPALAIRIATRFLEQYNSHVTPIDAVLAGDVWRVTVSVGLTDKKLRLVRIDGNTGKIIDYTEYYSDSTEIDEMA